MKKTKFAGCKMLLPDRRVAEGDLIVEGGRIAAIVEGGSSEPFDGETVDMRGKLALPGLVNAHGHTPMTLVRGLGGGLPLQRWLEEAIFPVEAKMTPDDIAAGMTWGALEMLAGGTVCVADMYDFPAAGGTALEAIGLKANICRVGLSFVPGRLDDCIAFTRGWNAAGHRRTVADLCIHSEYLTDEKFCRSLADANRELKRPLNVHVSETKREHDECLARHGKTPIAYLADTGLLDCGAYAAHCVWCTDDDFRIMRERGVTLVHDPSSNMKLGSGFARIPEAIAAGVNVALGTDGCASNDNLDMFEEMHLASLVHKGTHRDPTVLGAWEVIEMATVNGARALGRPDGGVIAVGKAADLCFARLDAPHLQPALDIPNLVVHSMHASDVVMTVVAGEILYDRGEFPTADVERARFDLARSVRRLGLAG